MRTTILSCLSILIFAFIVNSCSEDNSNTVKQTKQIIPTKVGNYWEYSDSTFSNDTSVTNVSGRITFSQLYQTNDKSVVIYSQEEFGASNSETAKILIANEDDGIYVYGCDSDTNIVTSRSILLKYPVLPGDTWTCVYHYYLYSEKKYHHDTSAVKCLNLNALISTPAGIFQCIVYEYKVGTDLVSNEYYVPGIGMIIHTDFSKGKLTYKRTLTKYQVEK